MTTFGPAALRCPECGAALAAQVLMSTNNFGPVDTDLYQHAAGWSPLFHAVAVCPRCGHPDWASEFERARDDPARLPRSETTGATAFARLAEALEAAEEPVEEVAWTWLHAAWCARDQEDPEAERRFRREALDRFVTVWEDGEAEDPAGLAYLIGELCRREGRFAEAESWWARAEAEADRPSWLPRFLAVVRPLAAAGDHAHAEVPRVD